MSTMLKKYLTVVIVSLILSHPHNAYPADGTGSIKVVVKDFYSEEPVADAQVLITPCDYSGTTDSNGEALVAAVVPFRNYQIEVQKNGYIDGATGFVTVDTGVEAVASISLKQQSILSGNVTMPLFFIFRWPLGGAAVKLQEIRDQSFITVGEVTTDFWGHYSFSNLDEETYRISAQAEGFGKQSVDIEVEGGQQLTQDFHLEMQLDTMHATPSPVPPESANCKNTNGDHAQLYVAPIAVPTVLPGPSELPYLYNDNQVFTSTSGSRFVAAGAPVYLRGFAIDQEATTPQEFNPDAPCFDIYGNKNGNFSASIFNYSWTLKDGSENDYSSLLTPSPSSENVSFTLPEDFKKGDYLTASLTVTNDQGTASEPEDITIVIAESVDETTCAVCHSDNASGYMATTHARVEGGAGCQDCHGLGSEHHGEDKMTVSNWPGVCGQCHDEFAEIQKANHSDPLPYGYYEPEDDYLTICYKCHYTPGYIGAVESGEAFHEFHYENDVLQDIPKDAPNISCSVCHDPHPVENNSPYGLRTGSAGTACDTCHYEKWQNAILEGIGDIIGNAYHYPGEDYTPFTGEKNPHRTEDKCVLCHMDTALSAKDTHGVRKIGGHTFRMRDFGEDNIPDTSDDALNIGVCQECHDNPSTFDIDGTQSEVENLLINLASLLKSGNHEFLPANEPGNCARCHRGGTVPFLDDPDTILENAYTNYKLFINDRSRGIHNPGYTKKLLQDSINSIQNDYTLPANSNNN